ncbi:MAG: cysteine desulfurase-like protein [Francisellaceae bacterium]
MWDIEKIRSSFAAFSTQNTNGGVFLDAPGGTQIPTCVTKAMADYMHHSCANLGGFYPTSVETTDQMARTRQLIKTFINARFDAEISFGQNMTTLTFSMSRAIADQWQPGDEIIVTELDHEANITPWRLVAAQKGVTVRQLDFDSESCQLQLDRLESLLKSSRVRLIAITLASNVCGSITDLERVVSLAKKYGTEVYVDAVHFAAHEKIDVEKLHCDYLVISAYKLGGPHIGIFYGRKEAMDKLIPYKIAPAPSEAPYCWETGTQNFEAMAGVEAMLKHKAALLGEYQDLGIALTNSMMAIKQHENRLKAYFLEKIAEIPEIIVYGISDETRLDQRTPTFGLSFANQDSAEVAKHLAQKGIYLGYGHFYVPSFITKLGLEKQNGIVRVGFAYYNTVDEIDFAIACFKEVLSRSCHPVA